MDGGIGRAAQGVLSQGGFGAAISSISGRLGGLGDGKPDKVAGNPLGALAGLAHEKPGIMGGEDFAHQAKAALGQWRLGASEHGSMGDAVFSAANAESALAAGGGRSAEMAGKFSGGIAEMVQSGISGSAEQMQLGMGRLQQMMSGMSGMLESRHDMNMSAIQNLR